MTAAEILWRLRTARIEVRVEGDALLCRPSASLPPDLRKEIAERKPELLALLRPQANIVQLSCPGCGRIDYLPLGDGWRRCWACGRRWGPDGTADPGDPPDLLRTAEQLGLDHDPRLRRRALRPRSSSGFVNGGRR